VKELLQQLYNRWRALQPRERFVLAGGGTLALLMLGYALLWIPMQRDVARLSVLVPKERAQLLIMRAQAQEIARLRALAPASANAGNLLTTLERSALEHQLRQYITRMEPDPSNGVRVSLDAVAFDALLRWLADLQRDASVRAHNVTITAQAQPGMVNARLLLLAAGT
jgi:general secretion pathway protein M